MLTVWKVEFVIHNPSVVYAIGKKNQLLFPCIFQCIRMYWFFGTNFSANALCFSYFDTRSG